VAACGWSMEEKCMEKTSAGVEADFKFSDGEVRQRASRECV
jgi:hypothetical protein